MRAHAIAFLISIVSAAACGPIHGDPTRSARGTISGSLRAPGHEQATAHRDITVVDTADGRTFHTRTNDVGDYTVLVPPGSYRVNVVLRPREILSNVPELVSVDAGGVTADVDVIIAEPADARR